MVKLVEECASIDRRRDTVVMEFDFIVVMFLQADISIRDDDVMK